MNDQLQLDPTLKETDGPAPTSKHDPVDSDDFPTSMEKKRFTLGRFLLTLIALFAIIVAAGFVIQPFLIPKVDPSLKSPVAIEATDVSSEEAELANLPAHSITRGITQKKINEAEHPLIPLLEVARKGLETIEKDVQDYTATIVSQVRIRGELGEEKYMFCKIRHQQKIGENTIPLSMYTRFLKPHSVAGQEAIWVKGWNQGKIIAHGAGFLGMKKLYLNPDGPIAMKGNRYPIRQLGMKNLIKQLITKGERDLKHDECIASVKRGVLVDGHKCTLLEIKHPKQRDHFDFHIARIYIDDERNLPLAYEGFLWPEKEGDPPVLLEKYFYTDVELNPGLRNTDFSARNPEYGFPKW